MTDKELIQAFRECSSYPVCSGCPREQGECPVDEFAAEKLVDRLEALLAENERLNIELQAMRNATRQSREGDSDEA